MADIVPTVYFQICFLHKNCVYLMQNLLTFISQKPNDNKLALAHVSWPEAPLVKWINFKTSVGKQIIPL